MTPRDVIAADLLPICDWMENETCATHTRETIAEARKLRDMLSAAGFVIVSTDPDDALCERAAMCAEVNAGTAALVINGFINGVRERAMLAAAETADGL